MARENVSHRSLWLVGRTSAFQPEGPCSFLGMVWDFNLCPGTECVPIVCVLSCVVSGDDPDILLPTDSERLALLYLSTVLVHSMWLPLQASDPRSIVTYCKSRGGVCPTLKRVNKRKRMKDRRKEKKNIWHIKQKKFVRRDQFAYLFIFICQHGSIFTSIDHRYGRGVTSLTLT